MFDFRQFAFDGRGADENPSPHLWQRALYQFHFPEGVRRRLSESYESGLVPMQGAEKCTSRGFRQ